MNELHDVIHAAMRAQYPGRGYCVRGNGTENDPIRVEFSDDGETPEGFDSFVEDAFNAWENSSLARAKAHAINSIKAASEAERLKYITTGDGKAQVYQRKIQEAMNIAAIIDADGVPQAAQFPFAFARLAVLALDNENATIADVVAEWSAQATAWAAIGAAIEQTYDVAVRAVNNASAVDEVNAALAAVRWPQPE